MRILSAPLLLLLAVTAAASTPADSLEAFHWVGVDGEPVWTATLGTESGPTGEPIHAETWYRTLDSLTLPVLDGEPVETDDLRGSVVVLDFWAGWCQPCLEELPLMQSFHNENSDRGLRTFAVNVDEPPATARAAATALGLELPVVEYTPELREAFAVTQLPTVVLVDRAGRIRGRWETFRDGTEEKIFWAIGEMLKIEDVAPEVIAEAVGGEKKLQVRWMREFRGDVAGLAVVTPADGEVRVALTHGRTLLILKPGGETERKLTASFSAGRLVPSRPDGDGGYALLSYRLGARNISRFDLPTGSATTWEAPAPVFDVQWVDPANPQDGAAIGTLEGIAVIDAEGQPVNSADIGLVRGLVRHPADPDDESGAAWLALTGRADPRRWQTLSADLSPLTSRDLASKPWRVQAAGERQFGLLPPILKTIAVGRFFAGVDQDQVAVAGGGYLAILTTDSGSELYRARWGEIENLAAGDLDGDGVDELIVAWARRMAVLSESEIEADSKKESKR